MSSSGFAQDQPTGDPSQGKFIDGKWHSITDYARRFGPKSPGHLKSWLTPLDPLFPINWANTRVDNRIKLVGHYQRHEMYLFTTRELKDLDTICDRPLKDSTLNGGIIPLLRRDRWEDKPSSAWLRTESIPIRNDPFGGRWQSSNDRVWDLIRPIAVLASQYIMSSTCLPWFDALLLGPRRNVAPERFAPGAKIRKEYHTFHPREGPWNAQREQEVAAARDQVFEGLMNEMDFSLSYFYSHTNPRDNDPPNNDPTTVIKAWKDPLGVTTINTWEMIIIKKPNAKWKCQTWLNVGVLEPIYFQKDDLSDAERAAMYFRTATTLAHEVMHAISYYLAYRRLGPRLLTNAREGYYQDEQMAEVGWSWQWAMHGGIDSKRPSNHRTPRLLTNFTEMCYPAFTSTSIARGEAVLIDPPIQKHSDFYPIGVQFFEDIHNQDFWDLMVRSFGGKIFQYRTKKEGTRITYEKAKPGASHPYIITKRDKLDPNSHDPYEKEDAFLTSSLLQVQTLMGNTPAERKLMAFVAKLAESAKLGKAFWEQVEAQLRTVREIIQVLIQSHANEQSGVQDLGLMTTTVREVVELLVVAAVNHEKVVGFVLEKQRIQESVEEGESEARIKGWSEDVSAKKALLDWNRGTRGFNREVLQKFGSKFKAGELANTLNVSYNLLEKCQALLFAPSKKGVESKYPNEQKEFDMLFEAGDTIHTKREYDKGREICSVLVSDRYVGSFVKSAARLLVASCEVEKAGGVEKMALPERHKCFKITEDALNRLIWLEGEINHITEGWEEPFEEYISWGRRLRTQLTIQAQDVFPESQEQLAESNPVTIPGGGRNAPLTRKRTRGEVQNLVEDAMEDIVYTDYPEGWASSDMMRQFKKMKRDGENPGNTAPE